MAENDHVKNAMSFIFEHEKKALRENTIALLALHRQPDAGGPVYDIMNLGVRYGDTIWTHPDKPKQVRGGPAVSVVPVLAEHELRAKNLQSDYQMVERDTKRAMKTLTQLVRGMSTDQDLRNSLPDCVTLKLGLNHLERTRDPAFRYKDMEPRVYENLLKDLEMIQGYFDSRLFLA